MGREKERGIGERRERKNRDDRLKGHREKKLAVSSFVRKPMRTSKSPRVLTLDRARARTAGFFVSN